MTLSEKIIPSIMGRDEDVPTYIDSDDVREAVKELKEKITSDDFMKIKINIKYDTWIIDQIDEIFGERLIMKIPKIIEWDGPYNEIVIPEGMRLIKIWELVKLLDSKFSDEFLGEYKKKYNYFWCAQNNWAKKKNYSLRLGRYGGGDWGADWNDLANSDDNGRVVFVEKDWKI